MLCLEKHRKNEYQDPQGYRRQDVVWGGVGHGFGGVRSSTSDKRSAFIVSLYLPPDQGTW